jgi:hypothetical protein
VTSSIAFIAYGLLDPQPEEAIATLNFALLAINIFGRVAVSAEPQEPAQAGGDQGGGRGV